MFAKRILDVLLIVAALPVALLAMGLVAAAVALRLGRPVLFRQQRAGRLGVPFTVLKFRSMRQGDGPDAGRLDQFGRVLRASALDELPSLLNVLRGEMSLVGPRPLPMDYIPHYDANQRRRLEVLPGLTGWAQVAGRNAVDWPQRFALDVWYVDHRTLWLDVVILWRTLGLLASGRGATAPGHATMPPFQGPPDG